VTPHYLRETLNTPSLYTVFSMEISLSPQTVERHDIIPLTFLNLVLQSAFIADTKILSSLLIAKAGLGKTIKLEFLRKFKFVYYTVDMTPKHLIQFFEKLDKGEKKFLVIPDYITTLAHAQKTKDLFRGHLRAMMEEGVKDSDAYGTEYHFNKKLYGGLISGITPEYFNSNNAIWKRDGFLSRFLPFSYSHSAKSTEKILANIKDRVKNIDDFDMVVRIGKKIKYPECSDTIDKDRRLIMYSLLNPQEPPYRMYQQIIALCNASAIIRGSNSVTEKDIELVKTLAEFINRKQIPI